MAMSLRNVLSKGMAQLQDVRLGHPDQVIWFGGGLGDELLCTAVARELTRRGTKKIVMFSKYAAIYERNPDVAAAYDYGLTIARRKHWGFPTIVPHYAVYDPVTDRDVNSPAHFITTMCRSAGLSGEIELRPYFYPSPDELEKGRIHPMQAVIHSSGLDLMRNKQWSAERYQAVADRLKSELHWIQLGLADDPPIAGALDLRGRTTLRETAAILANSRVLVAEAGFLMHMARAVETRAVIVYGGREVPAISGYGANENIVGRTVCSPCWQRARCDFGHECMRIIGVDDVVAAIQRQLTLEGTPCPWMWCSSRHPWRQLHERGNFRHHLLLQQLCAAAGNIASSRCTTCSCRYSVGGRGDRQCLDGQHGGDRAELLAGGCPRSFACGS